MFGKTSGMGNDHDRLSLLHVLAVVIALVLGQAAAAAAPGAFLPIRDMTRTRAGHTATLLQDGRVFLAGGWSTGGDGWGGPFAEIYEPLLGTFRPVAAYVDPRDGHAATLLADGRVLITGGCCGYDTGFRALIFDPRTETFSQTGPLLASHYGHTATLLPDGKVLIAKGGWDFMDDGDLGPELYDPVSGTFSRAAEYAGNHLPFARANLLQDGRVLITGGNPAEIYDPRGGAFRLAGRMTSSTYRDGTAIGHSATLLQNGSVLVVGGTEGRNYTCEGVRTAEIYEPATDSFREVGRAVRAKLNHTATSLPDGTVLIAGGRERTWQCETVATAELYDPLSESFVNAGPLTQPRVGHTATLLRDGTVLIAGGVGKDRAVRTAELYRPAPSFAPPPGEGNCVPDAYTVCLLGRFRVEVRYRNGWDNDLPDARALAKVTPGFADSNYETAFFYFFNPNNVEVMVKMLDQNNRFNGVPTIAVITGIATPARVEVKVTDTSPWGTSKVYSSEFGAQAGQSDFSTFVK
jgi:hypothetical protein